MKPLEPREQRVLELRRAGVSSARSISDALAKEGIHWGKSQIATFLARQREETQGRRAPKQGSKAAAKKRETSSEVAPPVDVAELATAELPIDPDGARKVISDRLVVIRESVNKLGPEVAKGLCSPSTYASLVKLEADLAQRLVELAPPPEVNPEHDTGNVEAAAAVRRRLERLVATAEANSRCQHCGNPPFAAAGERAA